MVSLLKLLSGNATNSSGNKISEANARLCKKDIN
jgi:hypothetical protein